MVDCPIAQSACILSASVIINCMFLDFIGFPLVKLGSAPWFSQILSELASGHCSHLSNNDMLPMSEMQQGSNGRASAFCVLAKDKVSMSVVMV